MEWAIVQVFNVQNLIYALLVQIFICFMVLVCFALLYFSFVFLILLTLSVCFLLSNS